MSAQNIRIMKEARALFWPWCAVMLVGLLHLVGVRSSFGPLDLTAAGFLLGVPLLTALSFGNEFQYRTTSLLLGQPVSRIQVWREKLAVMLIAVLSVTIVYYAAWHQFLQSSLLGWVFSVAFLAMVVGSATLWMLIARSTVGGFVLNLAVQGSILIVTTALLGVFSLDPLVPAPGFSALLTLLGAAVCYAGIMLWLGWRKLAGFQATGEAAAGHDLLASRPSLMLFRLQPEGPTLNLIKKELRLLRPVWLLTIGWIMFLLALTPFKSVARHAGIDFEIITTIAITMYLILVAILAGSIAMGEERQLGTHSTNLMLPISVRRQWLIKLACNTLASAACGLLVMLVTYLVLRSELSTSWQLQSFVQMYKTHPEILFYEFSLILAMAFPSFWSGCAANGTVRAAAWTLPGLAVLTTAAQGARFIGAGHWLNRTLNRFVLVAHPFPVSSYGWNGLLFSPVFYLHLAVGPAIALALFQSYRMFRREQGESVRSVISHLVSLWIVLLICIFSANTVVSYAQAILYQQQDVLVEVGRAVNRLPFDPAKLDPAHPQLVTLQELTRVYPLSETARTWLANASIGVYPRPANSLQLPEKWFGPRFTGNFAAVLQFSNGSECRVYDFPQYCRGRGETFPEPPRGHL